MVVSFRNVRVADLKRLNDIVNDEDVCRYLVMNLPVTLESTKTVYKRFKEEKSPWIAILIDGEVIGSVLLKMPKKDIEVAHVAAVGLTIDKRFWGKGIGAKALNHAVKLARERGIKRLEIDYFDGNRRAERLYLKMGFKKEGRRRKAYKMGRRYGDIITMGRWFR
jgi:RimJ/RimL family protein N-acetyltransferase